MLECLALRDFQRHERLSLDLDQVVCITGRTDAGKSSLLRALRWLCLNRPAGDAFIRKGAKGAIASLDVDGRRVKRRKGKGVNAYVLDGKRLVAFGQGRVPEDVAALLNVGEVNFQSQIDPPYWFTLSPGEVARELNAVVALDRIDRTLAALAKEVRDAHAEGEAAERRRQAAEAERDRLAWTEEAAVKLGELDKLDKQAREALQKAATLARLAEEGERLGEAARTRLRAVYAAGKALDRLEALVRKADAARERAEALARLADALEREKEELELAEAERRGLEAEWERLAAGRCPLCGAEGKG